MKAIIENKLYDTEKAGLIFTYIEKRRDKEVLFYKGLFYVNKFRVYIYKTKKGNYFKHFVKLENTLDDKEFLEMCSEQEVKTIIKDLDVDKYIMLFEEIEEA